jgi:tRNA-2-methylthio-N6-dimethylallyladenosine synthase
MARKLYIRTFGCQMNEYDSARTADLLAQSHGLEHTDDPAQADVLLVNTCSVREKAAEKLFSEIGRWKELKQARPELIIGVGGCVASQEGAAIRSRAPYVDLVYGPQTLHRVPQMLDQARRGAGTVDVSFPEIQKFDCLPEPRAEGPTAFVSAMEGCSKYCSFCVVPYTRGEEFSRPFDDVITEVVDLAAQGVREITFLGQNVNAYAGALHGGGTCDLAELIRYTAEVEGIERIRFTTSHPQEFSEALIRAYAEVPQLVSHLHLPVQSGSDRILARMKRGYRAWTRCCGFARCVRESACRPISSSASPGRPTTISRPRWSSSTRCASIIPSASSTVRGPAPRRRPSPTRCRWCARRHVSPACRRASPSSQTR